MKTEKELKEFIETNFRDILIAEGTFSTLFEKKNGIVISRIDTLEALDKELSKKKYELFVLEIPSNFGIDFIDRDSLINLLKNSITKLLLISDLYFYELNIDKLPHMIFYRNFFSINEGYLENFKEKVIDDANVYIKKKRIESSYGMKIAKELENKGYEVYYYGLPTHKFHKQARRIFRGYGNRIYVKGNLENYQFLNNKKLELHIDIDYIEKKDITCITIN